MTNPPSLMRPEYPRPGGALRRLIDLRRDPDGAVVGWVEDDFHHFGITIVHDESVVRDIAVAAPRAPWSTCPGAALPLRALIGKPLIERASDVGQLIEMRLQCTHMLDLAGLLLAHAWHGRDRRTYEAIVPDRTLIAREGASFRFAEALCTLIRDGAPVMEWNVAEPTILGPAPYAGIPLDRGFRAWTETLPVEVAEQAFVLRRAIMVAAGRTMDLDFLDTAQASPMGPVCHTYGLPDRSRVRREKGATRNYEQSHEGMLANRADRP